MEKRSIQWEDVGKKVKRAVDHGIRHLNHPVQMQIEGLDNIDWGDVRRRVRKAVDQGVKLLRKGTEEAGHMASATAHMVQLEVEIHRLKAKAEELASLLGREVHRTLHGGQIRLTSEIKNLNGLLDQAEDDLKKKEAALKRINIVRKNGARH